MSEPDVNLMKVPFRSFAVQLCVESVMLGAAVALHVDDAVTLPVTLPVVGVRCAVVPVMARVMPLSMMKPETAATSAYVPAATLTVVACRMMRGNFPSAPASVAQAEVPLAVHALLLLPVGSTYQWSVLDGDNAWLVWRLLTDVARAG